jgi:hypothetical protein
MYEIKPGVGWPPTTNSLKVKHDKTLDKAIVAANVGTYDQEIFDYSNVRSI